MGMNQQVGYAPSPDIMYAAPPPNVPGYCLQQNQLSSPEGTFSSMTTGSNVTKGQRGYLEIFWRIITWSYDEEDPNLKITEQARRIDELQKALRESEENARQLQELNEGLKRKDVEWIGAYSTLNQAHAMLSSQCSEQAQQLEMLRADAGRLNFLIAQAVKGERDAKEELDAVKKIQNRHAQAVLQTTSDSLKKSIDATSAENKKLSLRIVDLEDRLRRKEQTESELRIQVTGLLQSVKTLTATRMQFEAALQKDAVERERLFELISRVEASKTS